MLAKDRKSILFDFLTQSEFSAWRHLLFIVALVPIALSQSFFVFGSHIQIPTTTIYWFGGGMAIMIIACVYFNGYYLAPKFLSKGLYASYVIALLATVSILILVKYIAEYRVFSTAGIGRQFNGVTVLDGLSNLMLYAVCIASGSITLLFKEWMADNATIENLENKQLKDTIDTLKNRIHPTFLFATLAYASEKVKSEPKRASDTLFKLSELLRYQLYDCTRNNVLLASDIGFIRNYLTLEQQNSTNGFSFSVSVTGDANTFVPPALFIPWIEEIIRQHPTKLLVDFDIADCAIRFECVAPGIDLSRCDFKKAEQKSKLLYGNSLVINKEVDTITVRLQTC